MSRKLQGQFVSRIKKKNHTVEIKRRKLVCDYLEPFYKELPCKHIFWKSLKESLNALTFQCNERWTLEYFNPETLLKFDLEDEESKEELEATMDGDPDEEDEEISS